MAEGMVRRLREDELAEASRIVHHAMLGSATDEVADAWVPHMEPDRSYGAFAPSGQLVGFARDFGAALSVPGGADVDAAGVTGVGVLSNHRRQGHLSRLMGAQLHALADRGTPVALLIAAEWAIYGRFGYGPAIDALGFDVDSRTAALTAPPSGRIEIVRPDELRPELERVHELRRRRTPGAITRPGPVWDTLAGITGWPGSPHDPGPLRGALWHDDAGEVLGAASYKVQDRWDRNRPAGRADVTLLVGATPEAERELWRHLIEIDWITQVVAGNRGVDDPLPLMLRDGRSVTRVDLYDCIWARLIDVPAALEARRSLTSDRLVVEVTDAQGFGNGTWGVELGPDGAEVKVGFEAPLKRCATRSRWRRNSA
jgi:predicted acetyltransferase